MGNNDGDGIGATTIITISPSHLIPSAVSSEKVAFLSSAALFFFSLLDRLNSKAIVSNEKGGGGKEKRSTKD